MDKYEYNLKLEEISKLVENGNYGDAAKIADTIDWRRVRNARTLCLISEIYEENDRLEDSRDILVRVYKRAQMGRQVLYRLAEVAIKMREFDEAVEYYSEYVNAAPNDNTKYILKYKIYEARGSSLEERIEILEEYKQKEYTEQWTLELAKLYQQAGNTKKCIEVCDDLVLWFRQGQFVIKALELKRTLTDLTPVQQAIYDHRNEHVPTKAELVEAAVPDLEKVIVESMPNSEEEALTDNIITETERELAQAVAMHTAENEEKAAAVEPPPVTVTGPSYDTKELQQELASSMREIVEGMTAQESDEGIIEPMNDKPFVDTVSQNETIDYAQEGEDEVLPGQMTIDDVLTAMATSEEAAVESQPEAAEEVVVQPETQPEAVIVKQPEAAAAQETAVKKGITIDLAEALEKAAGVSDMRPREDAAPAAKAQSTFKESAFEEPSEPPTLTPDEQYIFSYFSMIAGLRENIATAVFEIKKKVGKDKTSRAGNIVITGNAGSGRTMLAMRFAKILSMQKGESTARIARIYAEDFNKKDIASAVAKISGGTLIIEEAGDLENEVVRQLSKAMEFRTDGLLVVLEDEKHLLKELFEKNPDFAEKFTSEVSIPIFTNDELVSFGKTYAFDEDYKIDDMATLALYNRIGEMQTPEHPVNVADVKDIVDKAIKRSERFGIRKLAMIISHKRYDEEDRIILYEKDFK